MKPDFAFANHGSITVLTPLTPGAREWCAEHLPEDAMRWAGGYAIEPRYAGDILDGISIENLSVEEQ